MFVRKLKLRNLKIVLASLKVRAEQKDGSSRTPSDIYGDIIEKLSELIQEEQDEFHRYLFANSAADSTFSHLLLDFITYDQDDE